MKIISLLSTLMTAFVFVAGSAGCTTPIFSPQPTIQTGPNAEVSFDGLHKVDHTYAHMAWAVPDMDLSGYTKILPVNSGIEYAQATNRGDTPEARSRGGPFIIDDETRARFEAFVDEVIMEELQKSDRFDVVDEPGPDVLIVEGILLNVASHRPPDPVGGRSYLYVGAYVEATLVLEVRDSETNRILARALDRRSAATRAGYYSHQNVAKTTEEVGVLIRFWGSRLREALEGFAQ